MKKIYAIDRIEGNIAVVVCDDEGVLEIDRRTLSGMSEGDVFSAEEMDGKLISVTPMPEEKERRQREARARLDKLFLRGKKN